MREGFGEKKQPIMKILLIGMVILIICLAVCIVLVSTLRSTYSDEISADFQAHHISSGEKLDATIRSGIEVVESAADVMGSAAASYVNTEIYKVLDHYEHFSMLESLAFIGNNGKVYHHYKEYSTSVLGDSLEDLQDQMLTPDGTYTGVTISPEDGMPHILIAVPVYLGDRSYGYLAATMKIEEIFEGGEFNYQKEMGECYLTDRSGIIMSRSSDAIFVSQASVDFCLSMLEYSDGKEESKRAVQALTNAYKENDAGFVSIKTRSAESLQISYYPLSSVPSLFFISCYNDNLVDDKVQPLLFRSVLSCIIIVVLMIAIIVYVWAASKRANITIEKLAYEDPVTKGKNINYFKEFASHIMAVFKETPFVIYRFDIVNFRYINEAYGHIRADEILTSCVTNFSSVFSEKELCVRMDSDQFLAIMENDKEIGQRLERLTKNVNEDARGRGIKYPIRFKTGVYQVRKHDHDIDVMIDRANVARKTLRGDDSEMTAYYSEKIVQNMRKLDRIESDMQKALANGEFKVFMQPKWDIYLNRIAGAEALVRWVREDGSISYPDEFVPIFENNGFIEKLDFYMLEMVCQKMHEMIEAGYTVYPVSVNQSRMLLHSADYVTNVKRIIEKYKLPENAIELEITESVFLDDRNNMIQMINQLKQCGVRLAMADFGSGFSSLNMLKDVSFDTIKIDREFFAESVTTERSRWILQKIVELSGGIGMEVLCEGVETEEQVSILKSIGCRMVQGFYFSKPLPEEEYIALYCGPNTVY